MGFFGDIFHEIKDAAGSVIDTGKGLLGGVVDIGKGAVNMGVNQFNKINDRMDRIADTGINIAGGLGQSLTGLIQYLPLIVIFGGGAFVIYQIKRSLK